MNKQNCYESEWWANFLKLIYFNCFITCIGNYSYKFLMIKEYQTPNPTTPSRPLLMLF